MSLKFNKAAMFGLDARIALAIFGALSVISGAALYSAIQHSKVIQVISELESISKSLESYYVDIGSLANSNATNNSNFRVLGLLTNEDSHANWKGPYTSHKSAHSNGRELESPLFESIGINPDYEIKGSPLSLSSYASWSGSCSNIATRDTNCAVYIYIQDLPNDLAIKIDEYVDGASSFDTGKIKIMQFANGTSVLDTTKKSHIYYMVANQGTMY